MIDAMLSGRGHILTAYLCADGEGAPWCRVLGCDRLTDRSKPIGRSGCWVFLVVIGPRYLLRITSTGKVFPLPLRDCVMYSSLF